MSMRDPELPFAEEIMLDFARLTGLQPAGGGPRRYLWTDAFAVCNYLEISRQTGDDAFRDLALRLVGQVHHTLGRHRGDDGRRGWISGLGGEEGERHPTAGGLRIGKRLPERREDEPPGERLEWDRDGQYFHYLTKWMTALRRVGRCTGDPAYLRWAVELAKAASAGFTRAPRGGGPGGMYWKMSIDLAYPLVPSMGQHDPLDGFVTFCELQLAAAGDPGSPADLDLSAEIAGMAGLCRGTDLATDDPLGTGGLLSDAPRIAEIMVRGGPGVTTRPGTRAELPDLLGGVLEAALVGLDAFADSGCQGLPADHRLAFRELGLSIGLSGAVRLRDLMAGNPGLFGADNSPEVRAEALMPYLPIGEAITGFWLDERNRKSASWTLHREMNMVMLATALVPGGFLEI